MKKSNYHIIGVMSGTSLDGIDLAEISFYFSDGKWDFKIEAAETFTYSQFWKDQLREGINYSKEKLEKLNFKYTEKLSEEISRFIKKHNILSIDAICSHGHTVLHQPDRGFTLQIGNLPRLAKLLGQTVVCDFRAQDVAFGGQGAPLVPIGDKLLFPEYDYCLNLGGFANCSFEKNGERIAFDICPVNIVLNNYAEKLGMDFDKGGKVAASGNLDLELLHKLNSFSFYTEKPPKSLGLEWVRKEILPLLEASEISSEDILRTFIEHIVIQIANASAPLSNPASAPLSNPASAPLSNLASVLVTGGGAYNSFLMERLKNISKLEIVIPSPEIVEFKEALIFGLLGVLKLRGEVNVLASVTGAEKDHASGKILLP